MHTQHLPDHPVQLTSLSYFTEVEMRPQGGYKEGSLEGSKFQSLKVMVPCQGPRIHRHTEYLLETY